MRLLRLDIARFRSIEDQWLPANGLVVLFGPNSAGKTSVLEAAEQIVAGAADLRTDPGGEEEFVDGSVSFALPAAGAAGTEDAQVYLSLLRGEHSRSDELFGFSDDPWGWLGDGFTRRLREAEAAQVPVLLAAALVEAGSAGGLEDRMLLARAIFQPGACYFTAGGLEISMTAYWPALPPEAHDAARRISAARGEDEGEDEDRLAEIAAGLVSEGTAHVSRVVEGAGHQESLASAVPPVILLDGNTESLWAELMRALPVIHDRLWHAADKVISSGSWGAHVVGEWYDIGTGSRDRYAADRWLETLSETGEPVVPDLFDSYWQSEWYRVRHSILAAAKVIEAEANRIAPSFVQSQGKIGVEVLPVSVWNAAGHRVRATFTEHGAEARDLQVLGAGTARWVAAAIRLACRRLEAGEQIVTDEAQEPVGGEDEKREAVQRARRQPLNQTVVRLEASGAPGCYIADEPEAHLHPAAVRSVRAWLTALAESAATVLVATHSPLLLGGTSDLIRRVLVTRTNESTRLRRITGGLADELAAVSDELGLSEGELLLLTRLAVFVEGPHDQIILDEFFGEELRGAGIHVFPAHGVDNFPGVAQSEIVSALGIRIATLSDDTRLLRGAPERVRTRGESAIFRLLEEARRSGMAVTPVGLDQPDILYYLDEEICRASAPTFPGWQAAAEERAEADTKKRWKEWVESTYGLSLSRDSIRGLARECKKQGLVPAELSEKIRELTTYADIPSHN